MEDTHTDGHIDCPVCFRKGFMRESTILCELTYPEAARIWMQSREFNAGKSGRSRYLSPSSLRDLRDYHRPLNRFFSKLKLSQIHLGHLRQYQEDRANGLLGPTPEDLFPLYVTRLARQHKKTPDQVQSNPDLLALVRDRIKAYPQREVGANKINQELGMLIRILQRAGAWTSQMDDEYEPLRHQESDIPHALTPEEQEVFLRVAQSHFPLVHQYAIVGIDCTLSTIEERALQLGDINLVGRILMVRARSAKNKYRIRTIPLSDQAVWALERLMERAKELGSSQPQHYLFPFFIARDHYDPARAMTVSGIKKPWNQVRREAGVPWFTQYGLRHTGCTRYAEAGMPIHTLLSMAGHMSRHTQEHYIHISEAAKRHAVQRTHAAAASPRRPAALLCARRGQC